MRVTPAALRKFEIIINANLTFTPLHGVNSFLTTCVHAVTLQSGRRQQRPFSNIFHGFLTQALFSLLL